MEPTWSEKFNLLPLRSRRISIGVATEERIRDLEADKLRAKKNYQRYCAEINETIKNLRRSLADLNQAD